MLEGNGWATPITIKPNEAVKQEKCDHHELLQVAPTPSLPLKLRKGGGSKKRIWKDLGNAMKRKENVKLFT